MVFPKPAGAAIRVSLPCSPAFSRSIRRGRRTTFGRGGGIYSFVAKIGVEDRAIITVLGTARVRNTRCSQLG